METPIYIIGHRNPDADAICSAIGYAAYKHARGEPQYTAARCGNSNARIDTILRRFNVPLPVMIGDVTPRVSDIMISDVKKVRVDSICAEALELIDQYDVRGLPVVDAEGQLKGALTVFSLGSYFIPKQRQPMKMRHVFTSVDDIVQALEGKLIHGVKTDQLEDFFVRVGAMDIRSFGRYYNSDHDLAKSSIIIVGDRYDIQQRSIQLGVRMLVITGGLPIEDDVIEMARERNVTLISSPSDSASTAWLIRSASRVERMIDKNVVRFRPDDKLHYVRRKVQNINAPLYMVVDEKDKLLGVFTKTDLIKPSRTALVLVDHNELSQAVSGADQVTITEVIDHHRLGNPPSEQPILFINQPLGSTSTIVAGMFQSSGLRPEPEIAGILMGGIISDTLNLQGPTTTERDVSLLGWLEDIAGCKSDELAKEIFSAGSIILSDPPESVIRADMKIYNEGPVTFSVSQVEELGFDNFYRNHDVLEEALEVVRSNENLSFSALIITDINTQNSLLMIQGDEEIADHITYPRSETSDVFEMNGMVSRKKQIIPYLTNLLRGTMVEAPAVKPA